MHLRPNASKYLAAAIALAPVIAAGQAVKVKRHHFLLVDERIIEKSTHAEVAVAPAKKHKDNPLMLEDKPWEPRFGNLYASVIFDPYEKFYKAWYSPNIVCESTTQTPAAERGKKTYLGAHAGTKRESGVLYGTSHDGMLWNKPLLSQNLIDGAKSNILVRGPRGAGVQRDIYETNSGKLFKALFGTEKHISTAFSPDGIEWSDPVAHPAIGAPGDTLNSFLFAPTLNRYVAFVSMTTKSGGRDIRVIGRTLSKDFSEWSKAEPVFRGEKDTLQIYAMPVIYHGGIYLGFPAIHNTKTDRLHTELAWSPDTINWKRLSPGTAILTNAPNPGDTDWGAAFATAAIPRRDELRVYYTGSDAQLSGWRKSSLNLATLGPDGSAGLRASEGKTAKVRTAPVEFTGGKITLSAQIEKGGSVSIEGFGEDGTSLGEAKRFVKSTTAGELPISVSNGKKVAFSLTFEKATVFGFRFGAPRFP